MLSGVVVGFALGVVWADRSHQHAARRRRAARRAFRDGNDMTLVGPAVSGPNFMAETLAPYLLPFWAGNAQRGLRAALESAGKSTWGIEKLELTSFSLGKRPPEMLAAKLYNTGHDTMVYDAEYEWESDGALQMKVKPNVGALANFTVPVEVSNVRASGVLRFLFTPLVPMSPGFGALCVSFVSPPVVDFSVKVLGGNLAAVPGLHGLLTEAVDSAISKSLLWPKRAVIPMKKPQLEGMGSFILSPEQLAEERVRALPELTPERAWRRRARLGDAAGLRGLLGRGKSLATAATARVKEAVNPRKRAAQVRRVTDNAARKFRSVFKRRRRGEASDAEVGFAYAAAV